MSSKCSLLKSQHVGYGHGLLYNLLALQWLGGWGGVDGVKKSDSTQRFQWLSVPEKILL